MDPPAARQAPKGAAENSLLSKLDDLEGLLVRNGGENGNSFAKKPPYRMPQPVGPPSLQSYGAQGPGGYL